MDPCNLEILSGGQWYYVICQMEYLYFRYHLVYQMG